ncbi:unnamed protein product [Heligmosomoides polygyrus]|uniref:Uncharacterized protein n=1 Tax=Heligmosomoides polygyrus TaxID=6339 RepID=A0A183GB37_HELPZ|nr:unnamed protein product [Heligmosomoides polygyrus]
MPPAAAAAGARPAPHTVRAAGSLVDLELEPPSPKKTTKTKRVLAAVASMPSGPSNRRPEMVGKALIRRIFRCLPSDSLTSQSLPSTLARERNGAVTGMPGCRWRWKRKREQAGDRR